LQNKKLRFAHVFSFVADVDRWNTRAYDVQISDIQKEVSKQVSKYS